MRSLLFIKFNDITEYIGSKKEKNKKKRNLLLNKKYFKILDVLPQSGEKV